MYSGTNNTVVPINVQWYPLPYSGIPINVEPIKQWYPIMYSGTHCSTVVPLMYSGTHNIMVIRQNVYITLWVHFYLSRYIHTNILCAKQPATAKIMALCYHILFQWTNNYLDFVQSLKLIIVGKVLRNCNEFSKWKQILWWKYKRSTVSTRYCTYILLHTHILYICYYINKYMLWQYGGSC